jgi:hypothetical protein
MATVSDPARSWEEENEEMKARQAAEIARLKRDNPAAGEGLSVEGIAPAGEAKINVPVEGDRDKAKEAIVGGTAGKAFTGPKKKGEGEASDSGAWTNLEDYLKSNVAATEAMKGKFEDKLTGEAEATAAGISGLSGSFDEGKIQSLESVGGGFDYNKDIDAQIADKYKEGITTGQTSEDLGKWLEAGYGGPTSLADIEGYQDVVGNIGSLEGKLGQAGTEAGRLNLIKEEELESRPGLSYGETSLNQALMGRAGLAGVDALIDQYGEGATTQRLSAEDEAAIAAGGKAASDIGALKSGARTAGTEALDLDIGAIDQRYTEATEAEELKAKEDASQLSGNTVGSGDTGKRLDIEGLESTWGVDPSEFYGEGKGITKSSTASTEEAANIAALEELLGGSVWGQENLAGMEDIGAYTADPSGYGRQYGTGAGTESMTRQQVVLGLLAEYKKQMEDIDRLQKRIGKKVTYERPVAYGLFGAKEVDYRDNPMYSKAIQMANYGRAKYNNLVKEALALANQNALSTEPGKTADIGYELAKYIGNFDPTGIELGGTKADEGFLSKHQAGRPQGFVDNLFKFGQNVMQMGDSGFLGSFGKYKFADPGQADKWKALKNMFNKHGGYDKSNYLMNQDVLEKMMANDYNRGIYTGAETY